MENKLQHISRLRRFIVYLPILIVSLFFTADLWAQNDLNIHGVVSDAIESSKLDAVKVTIKKDGQITDSFVTRANGKYEFYLDAGSNYEIGFSKEGYIERFIIIDSRNVPKEVVGAGIIMPTDMSMFAKTEAMEDLDVSVFSKPIGKAKYDPAQADLVWDFSYTESVQSEINSLMRSIEQKEKELEKEEKQIDKAAEDLEKNFAKFVSDGDSQSSKGDFANAINNYKEALKLKPAEPAVSSKLADIEKKLADKLAKEKIESDYAKALDEGDSFYRTEDFDKAIESYNVALGIKPKEKYPAEQITAAQKILAEREKNMAVDQQFNKLLSEGDVLMEGKEYEKALGKFAAALELKNADKAASDRVKAAQDAIANMAKEAEMEKKYQDLIQSADALFGNEKYTEAIAKYQEALTIKKDEAYPKEKIQKSEQNLQNLAMAAENEKKFNDLIVAADTDIKEEEFEAGIEKYKEALAIFSDNSPAKEKLANAEKALEEELAKLDQEKMYTELIAEADAYAESKNYSSALEKYTSASGVKENEKYPKEKIEEMNTLIAEQEAMEAKLKEEEDKKAAEEAALAAELEAFNNLVADGDAAVSIENFEEAIDRYKEALQIKPDNKDLTDKIEDAEKSLADKMAAMAEDEQYNQIISRADSKLQEGSLNDALTAYNSALELKPNEEYPASQIAIINGMIADEQAILEASAAEAEKQEEFNKLIGSGDKQFEKENFDKALDNYTSAKNLIDNELVAQKIKDTEAAIYANSDAGQKEEQFNLIIEEADALFAEESYEMARLKYMDASILKENDEYPPEQIARIDQILKDKQADAEALALAEEEARRQAEEEMAKAGDQELENLYSEAIDRADRLRDNEEFQRSIDAYNEALEIKPDEFYPFDQIEKINLTLSEIAKAEKEKERLEQLESEREALARKKKDTEFKQVSGNSEDQAEEFLREARRAQDQERYARIKNLKQGLADAEDNYQQSAEEIRLSNRKQFDSFRDAQTDQYEDQKAIQERKVRNSNRYKEALLEEEQTNAIQNQEKGKSNYEDLMADNSAMQDIYRQRNDDRQKEVEKVRSNTEEYHAEMQKRQNENRDVVVEKGKEQLALKNEIEKEMSEKSEARNKAAKNLENYKQEQIKRANKKSSDNIESIRESSEKLQEQKENISGSNSEKSKELLSSNSERLEDIRKKQEVNDAKYARAAERRRSSSLDSLSAIKVGGRKDFDEFYRTELAENYPQGVSEESSTQGNKVIITRIVVIGNKGDEYRKVLDKSGKYYFKNGQSISEITWNRETIDAFKD